MPKITRRRFLRDAGLLGPAAWAGPGLLRELDRRVPALSSAPESVGVWLPPFSEAGPNFRPTTPEEAAEHPTAVSSAVLPDGRILYWNGLEGTEDIEGGAILNGGDWARDSRARILDLGKGDPEWSVPAPEDGGAGGMFCSDQKNLPGLGRGGEDQDPRRGRDRVGRADPAPGRHAHGGRRPARGRTGDPDRNPGQVRVAVPESRSVLPPGMYYLFLNATSDAGPVPWVAATVAVG